MAVSPGFQDFILDLLSPLAPLPRRMFSGVGLFHGGVMFALLVRDTMYLRVDEVTRERYDQAGSRPFSYTRSGREVSLFAYYHVPEDLLDQPDELLDWVRGAIEVARRVGSKAGPKRSESSSSVRPRKPRRGSR